MPIVSTYRPLDRLRAPEYSNNINHKLKRNGNCGRILFLSFLIACTLLYLIWGFLSSTTNTSNDTILDTTYLSGNSKKSNHSKNSTQFPTTNNNKQNQQQLPRILAFMSAPALLQYLRQTNANSTISSNASNTSNSVITESLIVCTESYNDTRQYIQNKPISAYNNTPIIYFVTPTYPRREQIPELTRLAQTLMHAANLHWIVANDNVECNPYVETILKQFGLPFTYLSSPMPSIYRKAAYQPRGVSNRRAAIQWLRQRNITSGILYFGDDDNTYNLKLFSEIRNTKRVSMFPVGLIGNYAVSAPVVRKGKVVGFLDSWVASRRWPVDMAGFAVNLEYMSHYPNATMPFKGGYEEDYFLRSLGLNLDLIEPKGNNCTEVLVWHTQTKKNNRGSVRLSAEYLDERSNLGALFESLNMAGVSTVSAKGERAIISKNGKEKPLSFFLS